MLLEFIDFGDNELDFMYKTQLNDYNYEFLFKLGFANEYFPIYFKLEIRSYYYSFYIYKYEEKKYRFSFMF
jgi:hypothetical protein